jgi:hypothetical protein
MQQTTSLARVNRASSIVLRSKHISRPVYTAVLFDNRAQCVHAVKSIIRGKTFGIFQPVYYGVRLTLPRAIEDTCVGRRTFFFLSRSFFIFQWPPVALYSKDIYPLIEQQQQTAERASKNAIIEHLERNKRITFALVNIEPHILT